MVDLDGPRWQELLDAYGPAARVPDLLGRLAGGEKSTDLEQSLYGVLWHQGDVFTSSFAAVPHIVRAAAGLPPEERLKWLVLAIGIVATSTSSLAPPVPDDLGPDLRQAAVDAREVVRDTIFARAWKAFEIRFWLGIVAVLQGAPEAGLSLFDLDAGIPCASCGNDVDLAKELHLAP